MVVSSAAPLRDMLRRKHTGQMSSRRLPASRGNSSAAHAAAQIVPQDSRSGLVRAAGRSNPAPPPSVCGVSGNLRPIDALPCPPNAEPSAPRPVQEARPMVPNRFPAFSPFPTAVQSIPCFAESARRRQRNDKACRMTRLLESPWWFCPLAGLPR